MEVKYVKQVVLKLSFLQHFEEKICLICDIFNELPFILKFKETIDELPES